MTVVTITMTMTTGVKAVAVERDNCHNFETAMMRTVIVAARKDIHHQIVQKKTQERRVIGMCMRQ